MKEQFFSHCSSAYSFSSQGDLILSSRHVIEIVVYLIVAINNNRELLRIETSEWVSEFFCTFCTAAELFAIYPLSLVITLGSWVWVLEQEFDCFYSLIAWCVNLLTKMSTGNDALIRPSLNLKVIFLDFI